MQRHTKSITGTARWILSHLATICGTTLLVVLAILFLGLSQILLLRFEGVRVAFIASLINLSLYCLLFCFVIFLFRNNPLLCRYRPSSLDLSRAARDAILSSIISFLLAKHYGGDYLKFYLVWFLWLCYELEHMKRIGESITTSDVGDLMYSSRERLLQRIDERNGRKDWKEFTASIKEALKKDESIAISLAYSPVISGNELLLAFKIDREFIPASSKDKRSFDRILSALSTIPSDHSVFICIEHPDSGSCFCKSFGCGDRQKLESEFLQRVKTRRLG